jgi:hypothetical protein
MVAVPYAFPATVPLELTVAILPFDVVHVKVLFVAFDGEIIGFSAIVFPSSTDAVFGTDTDVTLIGLTVTVQSALFLPSIEVTVMVAVPTDLPVITPFSSTVATEVFALDHVAALFVAFDGANIASRVAVAPKLSDKAVLFRLMPVTAIGDVIAFTVTLAVAVFPPSSVFTVIVAVPAELPVTTPTELTIATTVLLLDHLTALLVAFDGATIAVSVSEEPASIVNAVLPRLTPVTAMGVTVTLHIAAFPPSAVFAVIVAVPTVFPVTTPPKSTVAIDELPLDHVTVLFSAFDGATVALSVALSPILTDSVVLLRLTLVTAIGVTVTLHIAVFPPSTVVAVIVAVPTAFPVTTPLELTVTIDVLPLDHVTALFAAFAGATVALSAATAPMLTDSVVLLRFTPVTGAGFTVTFVVAVSPPSAVLAVIIAVPTLFPVTTPFELTEATAVLLLVHVSF